MVVLATVLIMVLKANGAVPLRTVGVNVGDWSLYVFTYQGNVTAMDVEMDVNMTSGLFTVLSVSGTNVTLEMHGYYANGSDTIEAHWIDVDTGENDGNATGMLIAANLMQGDLVYTTQVQPFMDGTINETINRNYLGSPAEVNHFVTNMTTPPSEFSNVTFQMDWYWFKATGIPAEMTMNYALESFLTGNKTWFSWSMTIDDVIPEFPATLVAPVFMIATLATAAVYKIRKKSG
jgi:hypothetical protein